MRYEPGNNSVFKRAPTVLRAICFRAWKIKGPGLPHNCPPERPFSNYVKISEQDDKMHTIKCKTMSLSLCTCSKQLV